MHIIHWDMRPYQNIWTEWVSERVSPRVQWNVRAKGAKRVNSDHKRLCASGRLDALGSSSLISHFLLENCRLLQIISMSAPSICAGRCVRLSVWRSFHWSMGPWVHSMDSIRNASFQPRARRISWPVWALFHEYKAPTFLPTLDKWNASGPNAPFSLTLRTSAKHILIKMQAHDNLCCRWRIFFCFP